MRPPSTVGRNELQSFQTLLQPRDQVSVWEGERRRGRGRGLKPWRISNKFTEKKREQERGKPWKTKQASESRCSYFFFSSILCSLYFLLNCVIHSSNRTKAGEQLVSVKRGVSVLHLSSASLPPVLNLNSLGSAKTESMQLIMANESLFEQKRRGVH